MSEAKSDESELNGLLCDTVGLKKLIRVANAAEIIVQNYWKYINEDTAKEELKNAVYDYEGWRIKEGALKRIGLVEKYHRQKKTSDIRFK